MKQIALLPLAMTMVVGAVVGCAQLTRTDEKRATQSAKEVRRPLPGENSMPAQTNNLFTVEDLQGGSRMTQLTESDLDALRAVADWIRTFVIRPHKDLGRAGPVCPFVPTALERKILWLAPEQVADRSVSDVVQLVNAYKKLFIETQPTDGNDTNYKSFVVVFTDLPADRAKSLFDDILRQLAVPSYAEDGLVLGAFYESNEAAAIYNPSFRPFTPPVPFLLMRLAVIDDWKFFLDNDDMLNLWARRYDESAVRALAEELRRLPWREGKNGAGKNAASP